MKTKQIIIALAFALSSNITFSQVGIGTSEPAASTILDLTATDKALLLPRVANSDLIANPEDGMMIFAVDTKCFKVYSDGVWVDLTPCSAANANITFGDVSYQGISILGTTGIGYNGEAIDPASTITVQVIVTEPTSYNFSASHLETGLEYSASGYFAAAGTYPIVLIPNSITIPWDTYGELVMPLFGASNSIDLLPRIDVKSIPASSTAIEDIVSPSGKVWMDRNLGAHRVATFVNDPLSYGNLYQWGRGNDGHEIIVTGTTLLNWSGRNFSGSTTTLSATDSPTNSMFITINEGLHDWRSPQNPNLWQGVDGINNPCPSGYRLPTRPEFIAELSTYNITNNASAFASPLKITNTGNRWYNYNFVDRGSSGLYWTSTLFDFAAGHVSFYGSSVYYSGGAMYRSSGLAVRCIKD